MQPSLEDIRVIVHESTSPFFSEPEASYNLMEFESIASKASVHAFQFCKPPYDLYITVDISHSVFISFPLTLHIDTHWNIQDHMQTSIQKLQQSTQDGTQELVETLQQIPWVFH